MSILRHFAATCVTEPGWVLFSNVTQIFTSPARTTSRRCSVGYLSPPKIAVDCSTEARTVITDLSYSTLVPVSGTLSFSCLSEKLSLYSFYDAL